MDKEQLEQLSMEMAAEEEASPIEFVLSALTKRIWSVLLVFVLIVGAFVAYTVRQPKVFIASTTVEVNLSKVQVIGQDAEEAAPGDLWGSAQFFETQYRIIRSRSLAERVVVDEALADDLVFLGLQGKSEEEVREGLKSIDPTTRLMAAIEVQPELKSRVITIDARHSDPEVAARLANAVARAYVDQNLEKRSGLNQGAHRFLSQQYRDLDERLKKADAKLFAFKGEHNMLAESFEEHQKLLTDEFRSLNGQLMEARSKRITLQSQVGQLRRLRKEGKAEAVPVVQGHPAVAEQKARLLALENKHADLSARFLEKHPQVLAVEEQIRQVKAELDREIDIVCTSAESRLRAASGAEASLSSEVTRAREAALVFGGLQAEYVALTREQNEAKRLHELVLHRLKDTDFARMQKHNNMQILDHAQAPKSPALPRVWLNILIGVVLGGGLSVGLAILREVFDDTFRGQIDVEKVLKLPFLGVIPHFDGDTGPRSLHLPANSELFVHAYPKSPMAECCRTIRTNLLFMSPDRDLDMILVTSAGAQDGKTSTAVSIGTVMSQSNTRILIIDTDMRRPRLHKVCGLHNRVGLSSLMLGEADYDTAIQKSDVPNLDVLSCGPIPPNPSELIHTDRFREVLAALAERYDRIILDSPPTCAVTDAMILSSMVDGVVFVVDGSRKGTARSFALRGVEKLRAVKAPMLGCVINNVDLSDRIGSYHYYHHYQYYRQDSEVEDETVAAAS